MDMRGMGRSQDPGPNYGYTLENLAADLVAFLDAMGVEKTHFVGESLGALTGLTAAAIYPERFKSLTLVGAPLVIQPRTSGTMSTGFPSWTEAIETLGMEGHWHATRKALGEFTGDPKADAYWASEFARTPVHVGVALAKAIPGTDVSAYAPKVRVPVHLLASAESAHTDTAQQSELERLIPQARRKTYPENFHGIYYLRPDRLAQDTLAFVREVSTAQPTTLA
jgi:pimeloyl-ACP methyl ester carboxylesterase